MNIILDNSANLNAKICAIGVGGAGGNAINNMINRGVEGVTFLSSNTDKQALSKTLASDTILLGEKLTNGLGAGSNPEIGKKAAEETTEKIKEKLIGYDLIFITCGMGGGTGTGASPVIAKIAKDTGALVVAIVSKCFTIEGEAKVKFADDGITALKENVDAIIVVPNDVISKMYGAKSRKEAYAEANNVLYDALRGIVDIIIGDGDFNVDFADVRTTLTNAGEVIIGRGFSTGEHAGKEAIINALNSPFLEGLSVKDAKFILISMKTGSNYNMQQIQEAYQTLREEAGKKTSFINGESDDDGSDDFSVTIIAPAKKIDTTLSNENNNLAENEINIDQEEQTTNDVKTLKSKKVNIVEDNTLFEGLTNEKPATTKYVAANSPFEVIAISATKQQTQGHYGRPHGNEELKQYDEPAYMRRESKYNHTTNIDTEIDNAIPKDADIEHIQNIVQNSNVFGVKPINAFLGQVISREL